MHLFNRLNIKTLLVYVAMLIIFLIRVCTSSILIDIDGRVNQTLLLVAMSLLIIKILLDFRSLQQYLLFLPCLLISVYAYSVTGVNYILIGCLACFAIKSVNIKTIIKIDIMVKGLSLFIHTLLYFANFFFKFDYIAELIHYMPKGVGHSIYYANPNTVGLIIFWIIIEIYYLKRKERTIDSFLMFLLSLTGFLITKSRTPFYASIAYILIKNIKNPKVINVLLRYTYVAAFLASCLIVTFITRESDLFKLLNPLFSNRLGYLIGAYNFTSMHILPNIISRKVTEMFIIDNFYGRGIVSFGIVVILVYYIPYFLASKIDGRAKEKLIAIIAALYAFFEMHAFNVGFSVSYLLLADAIVNRNEKGDCHE